MSRSVFAIATSMLFLTGCIPDPKSGEGFTLPDGDAATGQATFVRLQCNACHTVAGVEFDVAASEEIEVGLQKMLALGGETRFVRTYGDLVTSIINPSHRFAFGYKDEGVDTEGQSKMRIYNDELTVTELTDLVAFLQEHYKVKTYQPTPYMPFY